MKFKHLCLYALLPLPLVALITSCGKDGSQLSIITNIVKDNFENPATNLGKVDSVDTAQALFKDRILNSETVQSNELLFDLFNFLAVDGLTIDISGTSLQILPASYSVFKLFEESKCVLNCQYDYKFLTFSDEEYYKFIFQGWITLQMIEDVSKDNVDLKKGDIIQFVYDIQAWVKAIVSCQQDGNDFYSKVSYQYMDINPNNDNKQNGEVYPTYGFVKLVLNEQYYPDLAIDNLEDINYAQHQLFKCSLV